MLIESDIGKNWGHRFLSRLILEVTRKSHIARETLHFTHLFLYN